MRMTLLAAVAALAAVPARGGEEPTIQVKLGSERVYEGQAFTYLVIEANLTQPVEPELRGFDAFDVRGKQVSAVSGNMRMSISGSVAGVRGVDYWVYQYQLVPLSTGTLGIPAPVVTVGGREYRGPEKTVEVDPAPKQDIAFLELAVDRAAVYPTQRFTVTLSVFVKQLPEGYERHDPTSLSATRTLSIPWALDAHVPEGLEPATNQDRWSMNYRAMSGVGFRIDGLSRVDDFFGGSPFPSFARSMLEEFTETFRPSQPSRVTQADDAGGHTVYWRYDFSRTFVPQRAGQYRFGPATLDGTFATSHDQFRGWQGKKVYAVARPIAIEVKQVPEAGRTEFFTGGIGTFDLRAELAPRKAKVNEPMTLTLTVTGEGTLDGLRPPDLEQIAGITDRFRVYEPTTRPPEHGSRSFTYSISPLRSGIDQLPPVRMDYFNVEKERYVSVQTEPISIQVEKADWLSADDVVAAGGPQRQSDDVELRREGLFVNKSDPAALRNQDVYPVRWLGALVATVGLYLAVAVGIRRYQRLNGDKALLRRRGAMARARADLREGLDHLDSGRLTEGAERIRAAVVGLVADVADLPEAGLTPRDVQTRLAEMGVEPATVQSVGRLLDTCDAARYGAVQGNARDLASQAQLAVGSLIESLKSQGRFR